MKKSLIALCIMSTMLLVGCENEENVSTTTSDLNGVLIFQAYGTGGKDACALSESFVELYNTTENTINLEGSSLQYSEESIYWTVFELEGTILPNSSFLITFDTCSDAVNQISTADINFEHEINNKGIKFCLMNNTTELKTINPFDSNVSGYIDMVCATDSLGTIDAAEVDFVIGQSKQKSVRRTSLTDTNNNADDFEIIDYSSLTSSDIDLYSPKNQTFGTHNPIIEKQIEETENTLLIYQVYGNALKTESAINRSFIELYNNSNNTIDLTGYCIQYMSENETTWTVINLTGSIPAYSSFLIVGDESSDGGVYGNILDSQADMVIDGFTLSNDGFAVCLLSDTTALGVDNPFTSDLDSYLDMVGSNISYYEGTAVDKPSKQKGIVRTSLVDTNNNLNDFEIVDYRVDGIWEIYAPKSTEDGSWQL